jgi:hypothetical protein
LEISLTSFPGDCRGRPHRHLYVAPGLRSMPWWDPAGVPLAADLEAAYNVISSEFTDIVLSGRLRLHPQALSGSDRCITQGEWGIFALATGGCIERTNALEVPRVPPLSIARAKRSRISFCVEAGVTE